ncbi:MAG: pyruvate kinase [Oscillospiraceae bacterium]|nr:pyruvate kinase [Oscillospiraceae bacterium]
MRKTKIVSTIGPASESHEVMKELVLAGLDIARFNFSHGLHDKVTQWATTMRKVCQETGRTVALLGDTKGPEIRIGMFADGKVELTAGGKFTLTTDDVDGTAEKVSVTYEDFAKEMSKGNRVLLDDGLIELVVESVSGNDVHTTIVNGGAISGKKSVNLPDVNVKMPYLSAQDRRDIKFIVENDFDFIAASFVRSAEDVKILREEVAKTNPNSEVKIIAKIENAEGVKNADEILEASDGLMVARGDLGVEVDFQELPDIQKRLIKQTRRAGKNVITATHMLESMIQNPRPTRAEVSDVANAVYDGTSGVMLSGETAMGKYPVEALSAMASIAEYAEGTIHYARRFRQEEYENKSVRDAISHATVTMAHNLNAKAILCITESGGTARSVSRFRPQCPIIGCTPNPVAQRQLKMAWGVTPILTQEGSDTKALIDQAIEASLEKGLIVKGDTIVITAGVPVGHHAETNMVRVYTVGEEEAVL